MADVVALCPENEPIITFLRDRQRELCGEWHGALTRAFQLAISSIAEHAQPVRNLLEASKIRNIGPSMQRQLRPYFASRPAVRGRADQPLDVHSTSDVSVHLPSALPSGIDDEGLVGTNLRNSGAANFDLHDAAGGSAMEAPAVRKFVGYVPKKGSAAYAIIITMLIEKLRGQVDISKENLMTAAEKCGLTDTQIRPSKPPESSSRPYLERSAVRTFYCGWSSMETLKKHNLVLKIGNPARYSLTPEGHAVALECVKRGRITLPETNEVYRDASSGASGSHSRALHSDRVTGTGGSLQDDFLMGIGSSDPSAGPTTIVERSSFDTMRLPPLRPGEKFLEAYDVILLIDSREGGSSQGPSNGVNLAEQLESQFHLLAEVRTLPVGDALWIARHKATAEDFVLDFILERKRADDLWASIKTKRFKDQKLRLQRCGLRKLLYLVEGSLDAMSGADSIRTAALQTEIEDGFDVQRTMSLMDTKRRYADLTRAITLRYSEAWDAFAVASATGANAALFGGQERCMTYAEFLHVCRHITADTVGALFGHMLLQIKNVTVEIAMSLMQRYPTLRSLTEAYRSLDGNSEAQALMLTSIIAKGKPISESVSRKVYEFVWT